LPRPILVVLNQSQTPVRARRCITWLVEHMLVYARRACTRHNTTPGCSPRSSDTIGAATGRRVLDLCTGTGALAVVAAREGAASIRGAVKNRVTRHNPGVFLQLSAALAGTLNR